MTGWTMGWYNGWSPGQRCATIPIQRAAVRDGTLVKPTHCSICGSSDGVWLHDEDYDHPLEAYPICWPCHRALHERFDDPAPWFAIVAAHGRGGTEWFEQLSADAASQRRPYRETYPAGLPRPSVAELVR